MAMTGLIFDLDGVLVDTARYHYKAWKRLAEQYDVDFDEERNELLKGVSRVESLNKILEWGGKSLPEKEFHAAMERKNNWYLEFIDSMSPDEVLPGVNDFLEHGKAKGFKIALGSASKNAPRILEKVRLTPLFDSIVDGNRTSRSKPDPEVFLLGAKDLSLNPEECIVFEDAQAGVQAAKAGGMMAIGVGSADILGEADHIITGFDDFTISSLEKLLSN
jgi:beta-phosphoglucomutase